MLINANLDAERQRAQQRMAQAKAERAENPAQAQSIIDASKAKLVAITEEQKERTELSGPSMQQYAASLKPKTDAQLSALAQQNVSHPLRSLAITREQEVRADAKAQLEATRLDGVKRDYAKTLQGKPARALFAEQTREHAQVTQAQDALQLAKQQLGQATTPQARQNAQRVVSSAERNLRTEYAKAACIDATVPVTWDHQALHDYANTLKPMKLDALQAERTKVAAKLTADTTGVIRGSRTDVVNDKVKLAIVDQAIAKAQKASNADPTRNPGNKVFEGPGMFVASADAFPPQQWIQKLKDAGVTWVALQINNPGPVDANVNALKNGWADPLRAAGIKVGFWGVSYGTNAATDARTAADLTSQLKGDFYIADCEGAFQAGEGDPARNKTFVDAFQDQATKDGIGNIPRSLSSMGRVALDMKPWIDNGWDAMPQAYWNSYEQYQPSRCVQFYEDWGWPKDRIHPTIATYDGSSEGHATPKSIAQYDADLKASGTTGFSYYLPESYLDDATYQALKAGIADGMDGPKVS
jgi:hypothetical protein